MRVFDFTFTVRAPLSAVAQLHRDVHALQKLMPPPVRVRFHRAEPLSEGSISAFTFWFGFVPVRWTARHSRVHPDHGFTDTQMDGPMRRWVHTHSFTAESENVTRITEHIEYEYFPGLRGLLSRLLFTRFGLGFTFRYRRAAMRRMLEKQSRPLLPTRNSR